MVSRGFAACLYACTSVQSVGASEICVSASIRREASGGSPNFDIYIYIYTADDSSSA